MTDFEISIVSEDGDYRHVRKIMSSSGDDGRN